MVISASTPTDFLYPTMLVLELIERTKRCAIHWDKEPLGVYSTSWLVNNKYYTASLVPMQSNHQLSIILNTRPIYTINSVNVPEVIDLYNVLGIIYGQSNNIIQAIQSQATCDVIGGVITFISGSGTWVVPARIRTAFVEVWGGGGAGGPLPTSHIMLKALSSGAVRTFATTGTYPFVLGGNDDGSTGLVPVGFTGNLFGINFSQVYVNNNGNITFTQPLGDYTPSPIVSQGVAMLAPFWADVDTRVGNTVTYGTTTLNGHNAFVVNWVDVRFYSVLGDAGPETNSFQLVLINREDLNVGDFDFEFNYDRVVWESGQASGGNTSGLGGTSARVGYTNGSTVSFELHGSAVNGAFLDTGPSNTSLIQNNLNSTVPGRYFFGVRDGQITVLGEGGLITGGKAIINTSDIFRSKGGVKTGGVSPNISAYIGISTGGGGAGGYTSKTFKVSAGQSFNYVVGVGATADTAATDTSCTNVALSQIIVGLHGLSGNTTQTGGLGGGYINGTGVNGSNGQNAIQRVGGTGGNSHLGGLGGVGSFDGHAPGGGGGGAVTNYPQGLGGNGQVRITYSG